MFQNINFHQDFFLYFPHGRPLKIFHLHDGSFGETSLIVVFPNMTSSKICSFTGHNVSEARLLKISFYKYFGIK